MTELAPHGGCWWEGCKVCNTESNPYPTSWRPKMTPGQTAYEKWLELCKVTMPQLKWENIPQAARDGWEEIAVAAAQSVNRYIEDKW